MRLLGFLALVLLVALPAHADRFKFRKLGFAIDGPPGWVVLSRQDFRSIVKSNDFGSTTVNDRLRGPDPRRLLSVARARRPDGVQPGLHLVYEKGSIADPLAYLDRLITFLGRNITGFKRLSAPSAVKLGPFSAGMASYRYTALSNGAKLEIHDVIWIVPMGDHVLTISGGTAPNDAAGQRAIRKAAQSLRRVRAR